MSFSFIPALAPIAPASTSGADLVEGTEDKEKLYGKGGNDTILGAGGADSLFGEFGELLIDAPTDSVLGDDLLVAPGADSALYGDVQDLEIEATPSGLVSVQLGNDFLLSASPSILVGDAQNVLVTLYRADKSTTLDFGDDIVIALGASGEVYGDAEFASAWREETGANLTMTFGDDLLIGGSYVAGDSYQMSFWTLSVTGGSTRVVAGNDRILSGTGDDTVFGDTDEFAMIGGGDDLSHIYIMGNDIIDGGAGDDLLYGDAAVYIGADGFPHDTPPSNFEFQNGADSFVFSGDFGNDTIGDFQAGLDRLVFDGFDISHDDLAQATTADGLLLSLEAHGGGTVLLEGIDSIDPGDIVFA